MAHHARTRSLSFLALTAVLGTAGCESITGVNRPDELRIEIDSPDLQQVTLITSPFFLLVEDPECPECEPRIQLVQADTTVVSLPYDRRFDFTEREEYFVESFPADHQEPIELSMKITIDDRVWYDDFRTLMPEAADGLPETLRFVYRFNQLVIQ